MKRPHTVQVCFSAEEHAELVRVAQAEDRSHSGMIRVLVNEALAAPKRLRQRPKNPTA